MAKITVKDTEVTVLKVHDEDYICITDAIKQNLVSPELTTLQASRIYANEARLLKLNQIAISQMKILEDVAGNRKVLK